MERLNKYFKELTNDLLVLNKEQLGEIMAHKLDSFDGFSAAYHECWDSNDFELTNDPVEDDIAIFVKKN